MLCRISKNAGMRSAYQGHYRHRRTHSHTLKSSPRVTVLANLQGKYYAILLHYAITHRDNNINSLCQPFQVESGSGKGHADADFIFSDGLFVIPITWYFPIPVGSTNLTAALRISSRRSSVFANFSRPCNRTGRPSCFKNSPWGMGPWVATRS